MAKGAEPYLCSRPHYKDGWCKQHHPDIVIERQEVRDRLQQKYLDEKRARYEAPTEIERAIVLLIENGYRVEKVIPK